MITMTCILGTTANPQNFFTVLANFFATLGGSSIAPNGYQPYGGNPPYPIASSGNFFSNILAGLTGFNKNVPNGYETYGGYSGDVGSGYGGGYGSSYGGYGSRGDGIVTGYVSYDINGFGGGFPTYGNYPFFSFGR